MRVLVTGADGFVGRHVVRWLQRHHHEVAVIRGRGNGAVDLRLAPPSIEADAVVHLACESDVGESIEMPRRTIENNVGSLLTILDYVRARNIRLIHLSTDEAVEALNPYGASKAAQEAIVTAYRESYGVDAPIVRADLIVGAGQSSHKFVPSVSRAILADEPVPIFTWHGRIGTRLWRGAESAADGIGFLLGAVEPPPLCHLGGVRLSNADVAHAVASVLQRDVRTFHVERLDVRPTPSAGAPMLADLGWAPPRLLAEELADAVKALVPA